MSILLASIRLASVRLANATLATIGGSAGAAFSPTDISGLELWFDASDLSTITDAGGGRVSQWDDKSGNGRDVAQSITNRQPLKTLDGGFDSIFFDFAASVTDLLTSTSHTINIPNSTIYLVARVSGATGSLRTAISLDGNDLLVTQNATGNGLRYFQNSGVDANIVRSLSTKFWARCANEATVFGTIEDDDGNTDTDNSVGTLASVGTIIFGHNATSGGGTGWLGHIHEILVYNSVLSGADQSDVEAYIDGKWGPF